MCGRYAIYFSQEELRKFFNLTVGHVEPRYNIAPSQDVAAVRLEDGVRKLVSLQWGLVPFWSKDPAPGFSTINARSETAHSSPAFRDAFRHRRCLIPASGFFVWLREGKQKQPWFIHRKDGKPMAFASLWDRWRAPNGSREIESCTILTTVANDLVSQLHNRMPVILDPADFDLWLDPAVQKVEQLSSLLRPADSNVMVKYLVSTFVNKPANEGEKYIEPLS